MRANKQFKGRDETDRQEQVYGSHPNREKSIASNQVLRSPYAVHTREPSTWEKQE